MPKPIGRPRNTDRDAIVRVQAFNRSRCQARFRHESWELDYDTYFRIWGDYWYRRGRTSEDYCMVRRRPEDGWTEENVMIVKRRDFVAIIQKDNIMRVKNQ